MGIMVSKYFRKSFKVSVVGSKQASNKLQLIAFPTFHIISWTVEEFFLFCFLLWKKKKKSVIGVYFSNLCAASPCLELHTQLYYPNSAGSRNQSGGML